MGTRFDPSAPATSGEIAVLILVLGGFAISLIVIAVHGGMI